MKKMNKSMSIFQKTLFLLINLLLITSLLTGCGLEFKSDDAPEKVQADLDDLIPPAVDIQFILKLPTILSEGERVVLEILDDVTGLPYNNHQYEMIKLGDLQYSVTLSLNTHSIVKYRYVKVGTTFTPEATASGDPVRYRIFRVPGADTITDNLQIWQGESFSGNTGTLRGTLTDHQTGTALADILISAAGYLTFTDANGKFSLERISTGVHNVVFLAMDGQYQTFQQGARIAGGVVTPVEVSLNPMPAVEVTFTVTPPNDALGVPIYMAGNLLQLGNTFADLSGEMSIKPKRLPMLVQQEDGTFALTLTLYAGTDLRYKFTLGDGYWNAEQQDEGGFLLRQLVVPDHDITLDHTIASWRSPEFEPITFDVTLQPETSPTEEVFIQLKARDWTEPLPLWPLGSNKYLLIVFSPLDDLIPLGYRFCRNENCTQARDAESVITEMTVQPSIEALTVTVTLGEWQNWDIETQKPDYLHSAIPNKESNYLTAVELSPEMDPSWPIYAPLGMEDVRDSGANSVVFSPRWFLDEDQAGLFPEIGKTLFTSDLAKLIHSAKRVDLSTGLFPQIGSDVPIAEWWKSQTHSTEWWLTWFDSYSRFILNYARIAEDNGVQRLIIGGKDILPAFSGGLYADGTESDVPDNIDGLWRQLISEVRSTYQGELVWASNAQISMDPIPDFIDLFDEIYITVDAPLNWGEGSSFEIIQAVFAEVVDTQVYDVYQTTLKPITLAFAYPSVSGATEGCLLVDPKCTNDGLFLSEEVGDYPVDLHEQALIYNAILPVAAGRAWLSGISIRGYDPITELQDGSSSINGKPALEVVKYWFTGLSAH